MEEMRDDKTRIDHFGAPTVTDFKAITIFAIMLAMAFAMLINVLATTL